MTDGMMAPEPKKKTCWLATASAVCALAAVFLYILLTISAFERMHWGIPLTLFVISPLLGIGALLRIYRRYDQFKGVTIATLPIVFTTLILGSMAPISMYAHRSGYRGCERHLQQLGQAIKQYAKEHNDQLPEPECWCDELIARAKVSPASFICVGSEADWGESSYAMNKAVAGMNFSEIPPNMVLLFEVKTGHANSRRDFPVSERPFAKKDEYHRHDTDKVYQDQWNQVGGAELLSLNNHRQEGCNILFGDGHTDFVGKEELADLPWTREERTGFSWSQLMQRKYQRFLLYKVLAVGIIGVLGLMGMRKILRRFSPKGHSLFVTVLGLVSGGLGCFWGMGAGSLYEHNPPFAGAVTGAILGLIVGICYAAIIANVAERRKTLEGFKGYATSAGMATGVICSTLVHVILMIIYEEKTLWPMMDGLTIGIITGAILGAISGAIAKKYHPEETVKE